MKLPFKRKPEAEMLQTAHTFYESISQRRTVRDFSSEPVDLELIDRCIMAAGTAPNGANLQPWHFSVITSAEVKSQIRSAAEEHEKKFYHGGAPDEWIDALKHLKTNEHKPYLEQAPVLIAIFQKATTEDEYGIERKCYYAKESVGLATGILITALHQSGLATLTHTPSPMGFLNTILNRPKAEKPFVLLIVGYPNDDCEVPDISKLPLSSICSKH